MSYFHGVVLLCFLCFSAVSFLLLILYSGVSNCRWHHYRRLLVRVVALLGLLLEGFLSLSAVELEDWKEQPEEYHLLQDSIEARESVRVSRTHEPVLS